MRKRAIADNNAYVYRHANDENIIKVCEAIDKFGVDKLREIECVLLLICLCC